LVGRIRDGRQFGRRFLAPLQGNGKLGVNAHKAQSFADEITHCSKSAKRPSVISCLAIGPRNCWLHDFSL